MRRVIHGVSLLLGATLYVGCGEEPSPPGASEPLREELQGMTAPPSRTLPTWCDDVATWENTAWTEAEDKVLALVNARRAAGASCGGVAKAPALALTFDERLRCAARKHSKDLATTGTFSHTGSDGSTPWQRINAAGYAYRRAAENIAGGQSTPEAVVTGWMNSTGHCNNIMDPKLTQLGVGYFYLSGSKYKHYWTQDFGTP